MNTDKGAHVMRKNVFITLFLIVVSAWVIYSVASLDSHTESVASPAPTYSTPSLPKCLQEDGAGQALCTFHDITSGDCALDITGDADTQSYCLNVHSLPSSEYEYQGAIVSVPDGADLVQECNDDKRANVKDEGWSLIECYRAWIDNK